MVKRNFLHDLLEMVNCHGVLKTQHSTKQLGFLSFSPFIENIFTINAAFAKSSAQWVSPLTPYTDTSPHCAIWQEVLEHPGCYFFLSNHFSSIVFSPRIDPPIVTEYGLDNTAVTSSQQTPYWPQGPCVTSVPYLLCLMDTTVTVC